MTSLSSNHYVHVAVKFYDSNIFWIVFDKLSLSCARKEQISTFGKSLKNRDDFHRLPSRISMHARIQCFIGTPELGYRLMPDRCTAKLAN